MGLTTLTACSSNTGDGRTDGKLDVVASFYPMRFLAQRIGGNHVHVSTLTKPGVEPHDLEISPRQTAQLSEAGLVVYLKGLQPSVDRAIGQAEPRHVADAASYTSLEDHGTEVEGEESHGHGEPGHAAHKAHEGDAAADPHIWLDPVRYAQVAEGVGKALEKADPGHAAAYKKNTAALVKQLGALNDDFKTGLKGRGTDTFITTHAAFGYLSERYGLRQEAISGLDPESEPSPARMRGLHSIAKKDKVNTVFFETLVSDKTAKTLAGDLKLKTDVLDPIEGIGDKSKGRDYFEVMRSNLTALRKALGAE
jgi:zinc transport system substrate-binding protein